MNKLSNTLLILCLLSGTIVAYGQTYTVSGHITDAPKKEVRLQGFYGTKDTVLSQSATDSLGTFTLHYPANYIGAALLQLKEGSSMLLLLNKENIAFNWPNSKDVGSLVVQHSLENQYFNEGFVVNQAAEQKLAGINYLLPLYKTGDQAVYRTLAAEQAIQANQFETYINTLPDSTYAHSYLQYRKQLQNLQAAVQKEKYNPAVQTAFNQASFKGSGWQGSGLLKEMIDAVLGNILYNQSAIERSLQLNAVTDKLVAETQGNTVLYNDVSGYVFGFFEKYGLAQQSEHLALAVLGGNSCLADDRRTAMFEQYRKMAIGKTAPGLQLSTGNAGPKAMADIKTAYKVVVFGSSWCPGCQKELPQLKEYTDIFKTTYDASIVFVSLDTDKAAYDGFVKDLPFINTCDFKGWNGENTKNYCVFATPTFFILDKNNTIVAKPNNAVDAAKWLHGTKG